MDGFVCIEYPAGLDLIIFHVRTILNVFCFGRKKYKTRQGVFNIRRRERIANPNGFVDVSVTHIFASNQRIIYYLFQIKLPSSFYIEKTARD